MLSLLPVRDQLSIKPGKIFINGSWIEVESSRFDQIHPSTNEVITSFVESGSKYADEAVQAARQSFDSGVWARMPAQNRKRIIQPIIEKIYLLEDELAKLQTMDNGVPYKFSRYSRLSGKAAADTFDHFAGWCDKITGETYPHFGSDSNLQYMSYRDPIGVAAIILAFNAPLGMFANKVAAALAAGCSVVVKPSENANISIHRLSEIISESELPPGVFNFITGGRETGEALVQHSGVDKVSFTGSAEVGELIANSSGSNMKRLSLELGGKSAGLVFPDTHSVEAAAKSLMGLCSTFLSGQICTTPSRAIVHRSIYDEFVHHAEAHAKLTKFGDPFDNDTNTSPIISKRQVHKILGYVESGKSEGATLLCGGDLAGGEFANGNWVSPALFVNVTNNMKIAREEIFGPVLSVIPFDSEDEGISIANDSDYGLAGCVFTKDISRGFRVARSVKSGSFGINGYASSPHSPMGGIKRSGIGREGGFAGIEAFTELKTIAINMDV